MASAHFSRREQSRFWLVAQPAKAGGDFGKSQIEVTFDVLGEDGGGSHFVDDPLDLGPQVTGIALAPALAGKAEWLTGITGSDDMNAAAPRPAVEGSQIVPDRRAIQGLVLHPGHESGRGVGFALDETNSAISGLGDGEAKVETGVSGTQRDSAHIAGGRQGM